jgi:hypothetical protein
MAPETDLRASTDRLAHLQHTKDASYLDRQEAQQRADLSRKEFGADHPNTLEFEKRAKDAETRAEKKKGKVHELKDAHAKQGFAHACPLSSLSWRSLRGEVSRY